MGEKWDERFIDLAAEVASWSKDPSTQVGCVLVDDRRHVVSLGYNGFPRGVRDTQERLTDRSQKYLMVQHAEANAVLQAVASTLGTTAYVTHHPCASCAGVLIQAGIARIVTRKPEDGLAERFADSFSAARAMLSEAGVLLDFIETGAARQERMTAEQVEGTA